MRPSAALMFVLVLLLLAAPVEGGVVEIDGMLKVEWHPDPIRLGPGEQGTVRLTVESLTTEPLVVALVFLQAKSAGACGGNVSPSFFDLDPGAQQTAYVEIRSWASLQDHGMDCYIEVLWGRNLTRDAQGYVDRDTADGQERITLPIDDDFSSVIITIAAVIAVVVVLVATVIHLVLRRRQPAEGQDGNPSEPSAD